MLEGLQPADVVGRLYQCLPREFVNTNTQIISAGQSFTPVNARRTAIMLRPVLFVGLCLICLLTLPTYANSIDADSDGIPDTVDIDDDNDGIPDFLELNDDGSDRDSDQDGMPDRLDLDSDNDGILDLAESGVFMLDSYPSVRVVGGRLRTTVGENGYADFLETAPDSRQMVFTLLNMDAVQDQVPDYLDLDSDNDSLSDLWEAGVPLSLDGNRDGRIDASPGQVGADGILDSVQIVNDTNCCDYNLDGVLDITPRNTDGGDLPDFQDLDSDNDSVYDVIEAGSADADGDGRIDGFVDDPASPDGIDDVVVLVPLEPRDEDGNGVPDVLEYGVQPSPPEPVEIPVIEQPVQPVPVEENNDGEEEPDQSETPGDPEQNPEEVPDPGPALPSGDDPTPLPAQPVNDDPSIAGDSIPIQTGLNGGGGCVLLLTDQRPGFDPLLLLVALIALGWLSVRRRSHASGSRSLSGDRF